VTQTYRRETQVYWDHGVPASIIGGIHGIYGQFGGFVRSGELFAASNLRRRELGRRIHLETWDTELADRAEKRSFSFKNGVSKKRNDIHAILTEPMAAMKNNAVLVTTWLR
jgi:hypothetical protein